MDSLDNLVTLLLNRIKKESNIPKAIIARVKTVPPNITLEYGGQTIPTRQIYVNNVLLPSYNRTYKLEGDIEEIEIEATTSNVTGYGPEGHTHQHGTVKGTGTYRTNGDIWLESTLRVNSEVLVELVGNLFIVVAQVVKMPNNAKEGA